MSNDDRKAIRMEQKDAAMYGDPARQNVVEIHLTAKLLRKAAPQIFFDRHKWLPFAFLLLFVAAVGATCAMMLAAVNLMQLEAGYSAALRTIAATLPDADIQELAPQWPAFGELIGALATLVKLKLGDTLASDVILIQMSGAIPFLVMLGIYFYGHIQRKLVAPHTLTVRYGADGLEVQRGDSRLHHPWTAVEAVVFQQAPGKLPGFVLVRLQFGYVYVWPDKAFASREQWQYTGHQLSALHLASRQNVAAPASP